MNGPATFTDVLQLLGPTILALATFLITRIERKSEHETDLEKELRKCRDRLDVERARLDVYQRKSQEEINRVHRWNQGES